MFFEKSLCKVLIVVILLRLADFFLLKRHIKSYRYEDLILYLLFPIFPLRILKVLIIFLIFKFFFLFS
jgi:hypothetical protein